MGERDRQVVWEVLAQFWADTELDSAALDQFAERIARCGFSLPELDYIAQHEVCPAFARLTFLVFLSAGTAAPDYFIPEDEARARVSSWLARPRIRWFLDPSWVLGYPISRWMLRQHWPDLRERIARRLEAPPA